MKKRIIRERKEYNMYENFINKNYIDFLGQYLFHFFGWIIFHIGIYVLKNVNKEIYLIGKLIWITISLLILKEALGWILGEI